MLLMTALLYAPALQAKDNGGVHQWTTAKSGGYSYKYVAGDATKTRFYELKNGMTVILSPVNKEPRMHFYIAVKAGSKTDPATHTGLAHYLEHMMFKGTTAYGTKDWKKEQPYISKITHLYEEYNKTTDEAKRTAIYKRIDSISGEAAKLAIANEYDKMMGAIGVKGTNAFTSFEQTVYTEDVPANAVDKFLKVQAERFRDPVFRIFHTELEAVYEEKNISLDNDNEKVYEVALAELFRNHNYGRQTTIGTVEHLKNPSLVEIRKYYNKYYVPNNMGIIVSGDFDPDVMIKKIDDHFSYMQQADVPKYTFSPEQPITAPIVKDVYGPDAEYATISYRMPGIHDKDALLADLVGKVLTNGRAGLIDLNLVKKQKLLRASAYTDILIDHGYMVLQGNATMGQSLEDVRTLMLGEIENLRKGNFDEELLTSIINNAKKTLMQQNEKYDTRAYALMAVFTSEDDWRNNVTYAERLSKLTKADIVAFANKYLNDNYVVVYKRKGEDKNVVKVPKPAITPVETNRDAQSAFVKMVVNTPTDAIKPVWIDYNKDMQRGSVGPAEILYVHNADNDLFRMSYRYKIGTRSERRLAVLAQYIQFLGTNSKSAEDISKEFYKLACNYGMRVDADHTTITLEGLQENFDKAVALLEDLMANCKVDEEALASLKARMTKARADARSNKNMIMQGLVNYARYGEKNPFNNVLSEDELNQLSGAWMVDMMHRLSGISHRIIYYGPASMTTLTTSMKAAHKLPGMFTAAPEPVQFSFREQKDNEVLFADYDMVQSEIRWVRNVPGYEPGQQPVIDLFNNYFGGNMGALVFQTIRESKALAYATNAYVGLPQKKEDPYMVSAYVGCQADKFNESVTAMNELLNDLPSVQNSISTAKESLKKELETERIMQDDIIANYLIAEQRGVQDDIRKLVYQATDKMNYDDLKKFHAANLAAKPYTYCIVASEKKVSADDMKKCGPVRKLTLKEIFGY
ncbi:insulinase family protein [Nemorincola caseinilytica]|uniref:Insulinase family protein n=2 Tax=Nemorincola caseinilytica TaxID=2054315 RepID=A0ABP8NET2_9BACT